MTEGQCNKKCRDNFCVPLATVVKPFHQRINQRRYLKFQHLPAISKRTVDMAAENIQDSLADVAEMMWIYTDCA